MKIIPFNTQNKYLGLTCKLSENAPSLSKTYSEVLGIGYSPGRIRHLYWFCEYENLRFTFVNEEPFQKGAETFYCLAQIGGQFSGDWYWFTLAQLTILDNSLLQSTLTELQAINAKIDALNAKIEALALPQRNELKYELKGLNLEIGKINRQRLIKK